MTQESKFSQMIKLLSTNHEARQRLLKDPEGLLKSVGAPHSVLDEPTNPEGLSKAKDLLASASIFPTDSALEGLKKLGKAADQHFKNGYDVQVHPYGVMLLEHPAHTTALDVTATGTTRCTFDPWDGCSPDVDW